MTHLKTQYEKEENVEKTLAVSRVTPTCAV